MSTAIKWIIAIIVIAGLGWYVWQSGWLTPAAAPQTPSQSATTNTAPTTPAPENGMSATNDVSPAAVSQDTAAIDAQIQGLGTDSSNVDSSLNDQPIQQSY